MVNALFKLRIDVAMANASVNRLVTQSDYENAHAVINEMTPLGICLAPFVPLPLNVHWPSCCADVPTYNLVTRLCFWVLKKQGWKISERQQKTEMEKEK